MIVDSLLDWLFGLMEWMASLLPTDPEPFPTLDLSWISDINYFLPISEMFALFTGIFVLGGPMTLGSMIVWIVVGIVRGGSTKA